MVFSEDALAEYLLKSKLRAPPKMAMDWLKQLLHKQLGEYCQACEAERMLCVLSPACTERILLKVRMQANATVDQLPRFCYAQSINNYKRFIEKKTTLYEPIDVWLYNDDFLDIMFPKLKKKTFLQLHDNLKELHKTIKKSNIPAVNLDLNHIDLQVFHRILEKDKLIREGTFIYDIWWPFLLVWFEGELNLCDFSTDITICNAQNDLIDNLHILDMVFKTYCAELNIQNLTEFKSENDVILTMKIAQKDLKPELENTPYLLDEFILMLQKFFYEIHITFNDINEFVVSLRYQNVEKLLDRIGLSYISYNLFKQIIKKFAEFSKNAPKS